VRVIDVIGRAWKIWNRRRGLALLAFALPLAAAAGVITSLPKLYRTTATVLVERQIVPESYVRSTVTSELEGRLFAVSQEIFSRARLEALITEFDLYAKWKGRTSTGDLVKRMRSDISLESQGGATRRGATGGAIAFTLSFRGTDPETVVLVTNRLADFFIQENLKVRGRQASGTEELIQLQLDATKKRLAEQERQLSDYKKRYPGQLPQHTESNLAMLDRLNAQLHLNNDNLTRALTRRENLLRETAAAPAPGAATATSSAVGPAAAAGPTGAMLRLNQLRQQLAELRIQFTDKYPDIARVKGEIANLQEELGGAGSTEAVEPSSSARPAPVEPDPPPPPSPLELQRRDALAAVDTDIKILKGEEAGLRASIADYRSRVENAPRREQEFQQLFRDHDTTNELYKALLRRLDEAQIAGRMESRQHAEHFRTLEPALPPDGPWGPRRRLLLMASLALSLGCSVAAVMLAERLDMSFHTMGELRAFSRMPVFSIARIVTPAVQRRRWRRRWLATCGSAVAISAIFWTCRAIALGNEPLLYLIATGRL
jgi:polysaccharide chain length determinant protein (PEP-CTERM system associated)